jgi:cobaltochelatase CobS
METSTYDLEQLFGSDKVLVKSITLPKAVESSNIPQKILNYSFNIDKLNEILLFLCYPNNDCLYISGDAGCGKTSIILQIAARLGWGVEQVTLSNKCESLDLVGHSTLKNGELVFEYGALTKAMLNGEILLLNEIDMMSANDLSLLNDVAERKPLTIIQNNGEVVHPHPNFRIICTANSQGNGDDTGFYAGARILNQAFLDRFRYLKMDYPSPTEEMALVKRMYPTLSDDFTKKLCKLAYDVRECLKGGLDNGVRQLSAPFSTRTVLKIAGVAVNAPFYTPSKLIEMCYTMRLPDVEREYILRTANDIFGHAEEAKNDSQSTAVIAKVDLASSVTYQPIKSAPKTKTRRKTAKTDVQLGVQTSLDFENTNNVA